MDSVYLFLRSTFSQVLRELQLCYRATWRDIHIALVTGCALTVALATYQGYSPVGYLTLIPRAVFYLPLYLYSFNLCGQIVCFKETDRIAKPCLPPVPSLANLLERDGWNVAISTVKSTPIGLPNRLLTVQGAKNCWCVVMILYILAGIIFFIFILSPYIEPQVL